MNKIKPAHATTTDTFGNHLRVLRRAARMTQTELSIAVGYSPGQISMLEGGQRQPDPSVVTALFISALGLMANDPNAQRLIALAQTAHLRQHSHDTPNGNTAQQTQHIQRTVERRVMWERQELGVLEDVPPLPAQLMPRADELNHLRQTLLADRRVALVGLPGMGKTTLAARFAHEHAESYPVFWMTIGASMNQMQDDVLRQLALFVIAYGQDTSFASVCANQLTPSQTSTSALPAIPASHLLDGICANLSEMDAPLLVFDDAHHLQNLQDKSGVLDALDRLHVLVPNGLVLFTARRMFDMGNMTHVPLDGLADDEARAWLTQMNASMSPAEAKAVLRQTQRNPLLLRLAARANDTSGSPAVIENSLAAISPNATRALGFLAICRGEVNLSDAALARVLQAQFAGYVHADAVRELQRHLLIERPEHALAHALIREPALRALKLRPSEWSACQRAAATWAEGLGDDLTAAHHWQQAGDVSQACAAIARHRELLTNLSRVTEAVGVIDAILASLPARQQDLLGHMHLARGEFLVNTLRADEARASFTEALALATNSIDRARIAERLAHHLQNTGLFAEALNLCDEALAMLGNSVLPEAIQIRLRLNTPRIKALIGLARFEEARAVCQSLLDTANKLALVLPKAAEEIRAHAKLALGYLARINWRSDDAIKHLNEATRHAIQAKLTDVNANALILRSATERDLGQFDQAEASAAEALTVAEASGNSGMVATVLHLVSVMSYFRDEQEDALQQSQQAISVRHKLGDTEGALACQLLQALSLLALNRLDEATALASQVMRVVPSMQNPWLRGYAEYIVGIVVLCATHQPNHLTQARAHFERALAIEEFCADPDLFASTQLFSAYALMAQGETHACAAMLKRVVLPPGHLQPELLRDLTRAMIAFVEGNRDQAGLLATALVERARQTGYLVYAAEAERLRRVCIQDGSVPTPALLPRAVICGS